MFAFFFKTLVHNTTLRGRYMRFPLAEALKKILGKTESFLSE